MLRFDNTYARLPERFYARVEPTKVRAPELVRLNRALAEELGADVAALASAAGAEVLAGNSVPPGAEPIALAYAGHQFGGFVQQLGDGRAILLGEVVGRDGARRDIQLKGAGRTPYSRGGDGRAALGPVLREYIVSEAMAALGIPTTRALAAVTTGERVLRSDAMPGGVLTRVAASHVRVGTFEYFAARGDREAIALLASYARARHYPGGAAGSSSPSRDPASSSAPSPEVDALALLDGAIDAHATLVARWLGVGFIHGVMNTDNTSIAGETLDYGPCAFLDEYDPHKAFSSIDTAGRYAFANQPRIALWNLTRFAEALLPVIADDEDEAVARAKEHLGRFEASFATAHRAMLRGKLGLGAIAAENSRDQALFSDLLERMAADNVDYTILFRRLCAVAEDATQSASVEGMFANEGSFRDWSERWCARASLDNVAPSVRAASMRKANPAVIPRNHRVEEVIEAAIGKADFEPFERLLDAVTRPYDDRQDEPGLARFVEPPAPDERVLATFCGT